jgi:hypothetical protein
MFTSFLRRWREARAREASAAAFVAAIEREPPAEDVAWLAEAGTKGDLDHARWELRYARRALGLVTAQRDALDDRTASEVARALDEAMASDAGVAPDKRRIVEHQLNARLRAYADALSRREAPGSGYHLGAALLQFAGRTDPATDEQIARAGDIASRYLTEANAALRDCYGAAELPEDIAPSAIVARR